MQNYQEFINKYFDLWVDSGFVEVYDNTSSEIIQSSLQENKLTLAKEEIDTLTLPTIQSDVQNEREAFLIILQKAKLNENVEDLIKKIYW